MEENKRVYPISEEEFNRKVLPIIEEAYIWKGRPPKISHYQVLCGILYILRTGCPWRDLPEEYGYWHVLYDRFSWGSERGLWAKILLLLQEEEGIVLNEVIIDSTTMTVHRHGGGPKGGNRRKGRVGRGYISGNYWPDQHGITPGRSKWASGFRSGGRNQRTGNSSGG